MEMDLQKKVMVWNRSVGSVSYTIDDLRIRREWAREGDKHMVSLGELQALKYVPGGQKLMERYLLIKDQDACEFLELPQDPEYFYDEAAVEVLLREGTIDQLLDCLEFAPRGVIDLVKRVSIAIKLDSSEKRKIIGEHLKINLDAMIRNSEDSVEASETVAPASKRRSAPVVAAKEAPASKYNVVNRK